MSAPLLFLDVDGPLIPFGGVAGDYEIFTDGELTNPLLARVNPALGPRLLALGCHLIWATSWLDEANECLAPLLGLPALPVTTWPDSPDDDHDALIGLHWKTRHILTTATGRAFVWIDDETTDTDRAWVAEHHPTPALLHTVPAETGLTTDDFDTITAWLTSTRPPHPTPHARRHESALTLAPGSSRQGAGD